MANATGKQNTLIVNFKAARRVSTPIVAIETPDASATIDALRKVIGETAPMFQWDFARGTRPLNKAAQDAPPALTSPTSNPTDAFVAFEDAPGQTVLFVHNAHKLMNDIQTVQAIWNLRDLFKVNKRMIVLLGPTHKLPAELANDVTLLVEPLPTRDELRETLVRQYANANLPEPAESIIQAALDAVVGLPAYTAEQQIAMSIKKTGVDVPMLWDCKRATIGQTPGLSIMNVESRFDDLGGIDNAITFARKVIKAKLFNAILFIDEGDKSMAGGMSDHVGDGGVTKDQVGQILTYMEDHECAGVLYGGAAGCGKTELAKAIGWESGKPVIVFDMGAMRGGHVGDSERMIREALKVVTAVSEGKLLVIMTANRTSSFTPEINRRFPDQFYFDIPSDAARAAIWPVYVRKYNLSKEQAAFPAGFDAGWTGAEIKRACKRAAAFGESVQDAASYIVPMSISAKRVLDEMRHNAAGRFLSASEPGVYRVSPAVVAAAETVAARGERTIEVE